VEWKWRRWGGRGEERRVRKESEEDEIGTKAQDEVEDEEESALGAASWLYVHHGRYVHSEAWQNHNA
jgi:hypothetical protein